MEFLGKPLYFFILCVAFADGQREVDISVNGDHVVKTNISTYTIYDRDHTSDRTLTISCLSFLPVPPTISLVRNGTMLNDTFAYNTYTNRPNIAIANITFNRNNVTYLEGAYSCCFNSSVHTYNGTQLEYFMEREIQIYTTTKLQDCASSIGRLGYFGEKVTLLCEQPDCSLKAGFFQGQWLRSQHSLLEVNLLENNTFTCFYPYNQINACSINIDVYRSLEIEISPKHFTLHSHIMEFSCKSTPPRLLHWNFFGDDGNIIELYTNDRLLQAGGNITIKQEAGWSSLRVSFMGNTDLGINKVMCAAYGTRKRRVAYATIEPSNSPIEPTPENTTINVLDVSLCTLCPPQTSYPTSDKQTSTMTEMSTRSQSRNTGEGEISTDFAQDSVTTVPPPERWFSLISSEELTVCIFVIASCEALLLLIIAGVWNYPKCRRGTKESHSKTASTGEAISSEIELHGSLVYISPEIELHDNPVYISYDETPTLHLQ